MRCKPGLAVYVYEFTLAQENIGRIVTISRLATGEEIRRNKLNPFAGPIWFLSSGTIKWVDVYGEYELPFCHDRRLDPIRPAPEKVERDEEVTA